MNSKRKELSTIYWSGLVVPIVICLLVLSAIVVVLTTNIGEPHPALRAKIPIPKGGNSL